MSVVQSLKLSALQIPETSHCTSAGWLILIVTIPLNLFQNCENHLSFTLEQSMLHFSICQLNPLEISVASFSEFGGTGRAEGK